VHPAEALQPDRVEQLALARFAGLILGDLDVAVQRVSDEVDLAETLRSVQGATRGDLLMDETPANCPCGNLYAIAAAGRPDSGAVIAMWCDRNHRIDVTTR
jgi:hypothetical protein